MNPAPTSNHPFTPSSSPIVPPSPAPFQSIHEESSHRGFGRPSNYTPETIGLLQGLIRELGLSDTAAAARLGIGASTLSRWKRENPELRLHLRQAREECRSLQLQHIMKSATAEHGRGWRAAAWVLERFFPEDYHPSAGQRHGFRQLAELQEANEAREPRPTFHSDHTADSWETSQTFESPEDPLPEFP